MNDARNLLQKAINKAGSQQALAAAIGVSQQQVSYLMTKARRIPAEIAIAVERATDGEVSRNELRPDIFGDAQ
jgi:DNA-binding transcriptional regulator YdaS (Cro superfamily)